MLKVSEKLAFHLTLRSIRNSLSLLTFHFYFNLNYSRVDTFAFSSRMLGLLCRLTHTYGHGFSLKT